MKIQHLFLSALITIYNVHAEESSSSSTPTTATNQQPVEPPEGYYAFVESPNAEPPQIRPPPYSYAPIDCRDDDSKGGQVSPYNLCGDLNRGTIPRNPMGQNVMGSPYPFELLRNMTLKYLSRALPILKADETLPKVAHLQDEFIAQNTISTSYQNDGNNERIRRDVSSSAAPQQTSESAGAGSETSESANRQSRKFCDQGGIFCMLYKVINGESYSSSPPAATIHHVAAHPHHVHHVAHHVTAAERRDEGVVPLHAQPQQPRYEGPPTPCPAKVEYATPVFAKNYQGVWRYVVQIPYEGYFTQTVEVTRCVQARCHYLDGGCLASPRWTSLLVAEIFYPETILSAADSLSGNPQRNPVSASQSQPPSVQDFQNYQQYLHKRAGLQASSVDTQQSSGQTTTKPPHCDGIDALGCFQVRLYYDWFLIPGSCKCWRPDYFNKYVRRKTTTSDL